MRHTVDLYLLIKINLKNDLPQKHFENLYM